MSSKTHPPRTDMTLPASGLRRGLLGAGLLACAGLPRAARAQTASGALSIGVLPNVSARILLASYQPMREYFERELRQPVSIVTAPDFRSFAANSLKGDYDLIVTAPNLGRVMQLDARWEPLAIYEPRIPAVVVARADNTDDSPRQLRGKALALANPQSLVALVGLQWLKSEGLQEGVDFQTVVAANDDSLGAVLRSGEAPWAVMSMGEFRSKPEALRQSLRIVRQITTVPGFFVMANPSLPLPQRQRLKALILAFAATPDGGRFFELSGFRGIRELADADLSFADPFNDLTRRGLGLKP
jgi:phosphonate transport system substrate-binding protein